MTEKDETMATADPKAAFTGDFERLREGLPGRGAAWLDALRRDAISAFALAGFPGVRDEDWKYTNILPALKDRLEPVLDSEAAAVDDSRLRPLVSQASGITADAPLVVFVDGHFRASLSRPGGSVAGASVRLSSLRERLATDPQQLEPWLGRYLPVAAHGFAALNTAFLDDGAVIEIAEGAINEQPLHVVYLATRRERPFVAYPRNVVIAGPRSSALVVEHYIGEDGARCLTNAASEVVLRSGAVLGHVRIQDEAKSSFHVARVEVEQGPGSNFVSHAFGFGAALSRTELTVRLAGEQAECRMSGLYAMDGSRHVDHHVTIDHCAPHTRSDQLFKGILDDKSRGVFTGRVLVRAGSQKIRAMQKNPSILLGEGAVAETRPQLEIYADDVVCNHGATVGRLDESALFYLLSRGIDPREARRLLVAGFAAEVVESVVPETLRHALTAMVGERIRALGTAAKGQAA